MPIQKMLRSNKPTTENLTMLSFDIEFVSEHRSFPRSLSSAKAGERESSLITAHFHLVSAWIRLRGNDNKWAALVVGK